MARRARALANSWSCRRIVKRAAHRCRCTHTDKRARVVPLRHAHTHTLRARTPVNTWSYRRIITHVHGRMRTIAAHARLSGANIPGHMLYAHSNCAGPHARACKHQVMRAHHFTRTRARACKHEVTWAHQITGTRALANTASQGRTCARLQTRCQRTSARPQTLQVTQTRASICKHQVMRTHQLTRTQERACKHQVTQVRERLHTSSHAHARLQTDVKQACAPVRTPGHRDGRDARTCNHQVTRPRAPTHQVKPARARRQT